MAENKTIITSLLRQCEWMWENCIRNNEAGEFRLNEIIPAKGTMTKRAGHVFTDLDMCQHWELFGTKFYPVEGMQWDERDRSVKLTFDNFSCGYKLKDVLPLTLKYIKTCMPSMLNKVLFCTDGRERWVAYVGQPKKTANATPAVSVADGSAIGTKQPGEAAGAVTSAAPQASVSGASPATAPVASATSSPQPSFAELLRNILLAS